LRGCHSDVSFSETVLNADDALKIAHVLTTAHFLNADAVLNTVSTNISFCELSDSSEV
jgi:hypothetical protein